MSDYIKLLEKQNEQLMEMLKESQENCKFWVNFLKEKSTRNLCLIVKAHYDCEGLTSDKNAKSYSTSKNYITVFDGKASIKGSLIHILDTFMYKNHYKKCTFEWSLIRYKRSEENVMLKGTVIISEYSTNNNPKIIETKGNCKDWLLKLTDMKTSDII